MEEVEIWLGDKLLGTAQNAQIDITPEMIAEANVKPLSFSEWSEPISWSITATPSESKTLRALFKSIPKARLPRKQKKQFKKAVIQALKDGRFTVEPEHPQSEAESFTYEMPGLDLTHLKNDGI